ncbi:MAG: hypothetical protein COA53_00770 [Rhodobacteraceae bacterium]|nr:MAG: hypothetical protein COA53_00770 [Paracoccaceae bacterium]
MKKFAILIGTLAALSAGPIAAQSQLEPLSNQEVLQITESVQKCFSDASTEAGAEACLDIPRETLDIWLPCGDRANTTYEMSFCSGQIKRVLDRVLNTEYQISIKYEKYWDSESPTEVWDPVIQARVVVSKEEILRSAQRAWLAYRDADCLARIGPNTGYRMYSTNFTGCIASFTKERIMNIVLIRMGGYSSGEYSPENFYYDDYK